MGSAIQPDLIAPCGMNCALCSAYQTIQYDLDKHGFRKFRCPGCIPRGKNCHYMGDRCELLRDGRVRFCFDCEAFPCKHLKTLDKRYSAKYHMSMIENLRSIQANGLEAFLKQQEEQWLCGQCGEHLLCCHNGLCLHCELDVLKSNKRYRWGEQNEIRKP